MTELRVVIPNEVAERLAEEARARGGSAEALAAEVLELHLEAATRRRPSFVASRHSGRHDLSERAEELLTPSPGVIICDTGNLVRAADADDAHNPACPWPERFFEATLLRRFADCTLPHPEPTSRDGPEARARTGAKRASEGSQRPLTSVGGRGP